MNKYEEVEKYGLNTRDKKYLLRYLSGEKLTPMQTIHAKCYECQGYCADGKNDCGIEDCPNYPYFRYNPHRIVTKKILTERERAEIGERFKKAKKARTEIEVVKG